MSLRPEDKFLHRTVQEDYGDKVKINHWSQSTLHQQQERFGQGAGKKSVKEDKLEKRDPFSDLQDISDKGKKISSTQSSSAESGGKRRQQ